MSSGVHTFSNYKAFLKNWTKSLEKRSGQLQSLAAYLRVHPSRLTRILRGNEHPSQEQAYLIANFLNLGELETAYFVELINLEKATIPAYKKHVEGLLQDLHSKIEKPVDSTDRPHTLTLSEEKIYYSSYRYGAVWLCSMISSMNDVDSICKLLSLDRKTVEVIAKFLVEIDLCKWQDGRLVPGPQFLEIKGSSPHIESFLSIWRLHALNSIPNRKPKNFHYSAPMAMGAEASVHVQAILDRALAEIQAVVFRYPADQVRCLNVDFFDL
jgi:transcriptional regulator with XRE-family HTH domain